MEIEMVPVSEAPARKTGAGRPSVLPMLIEKFRASEHAIVRVNGFKGKPESSGGNIRRHLKDKKVLDVRVIVGVDPIKGDVGVFLEKISG